MTQQPERANGQSARPGVGISLPIVSSGPVFWKSLEELAGKTAPCTSPHRGEVGRRPGEGAELPLASAVPRGVVPEPGEDSLDEPSRREFLRLMAASLALGGIGGCAYQPAESIVPYVQAPEEIVPGKPLFFATAVPLDGFACGVLVKSEMGRPIKVEGNPDHPASLGATDAVGQAALLGLYDPDRSQLVIRNGRIDTWEHFLTFALDLRESLRTRKGAGLRILTRTVASPTLADQLGRLLAQFPEAKWHAYEPVMRDAIHAGCRLVFGEDVEPLFHIDRADVIVALDADFLAWGPGRLKDARAFASRRQPRDGQAKGPMNRLYVVECSPTLTGAAADHRLAVPARDIAPFARAIADALRVGGAGDSQADHFRPDRPICRLDQRGRARPGVPSRQEPRPRWRLSAARGLCTCTSH